MTAKTPALFISGAKKTRAFILFSAVAVDHVGRYIPEHRVVHLDLKGGPPKMSYLKNILPLLKEAGATALLIEYEDMFPYWCRSYKSSKNCFTGILTIFS